MNFNFEQFVETICDSIETSLTKEEVNLLLKLDDDGYNIGELSSTGKRILLNRIVIEGEKEVTGTFHYDKVLYNGINMWIADNFKGKSTLFKAIRLALTGNNDISAQMKSWIQQIKLQLTIAESVYTIHLDLTAKSLGAKIYLGTLDIIGHNNPVYEFGSLLDFKEHMQDFIFDSLDYYPLRRVKANQRKVNLVEDDVSWATYFMSIYIQSKDYNLLAFANLQGGIFQVLMGLPYTYALYALEVKEKNLTREIASLKQNLQKDETTKPISHASQRLQEIETTIADLRNDRTRNEINTNRQNINLLSTELERLRREKSTLEKVNFDRTTEEQMLNFMIDQKKIELDEINKDIRKTKKSINKQKEYMEAGIFFSNLEVTECPHCENSVTEEKILKEKENHTCMLCDRPMEETDFDKSTWEERIAESETELSSYEILKDKKNTELNSLTEKHQSIKKIFSQRNAITALEQEIQKKETQLFTIEETLAELFPKLSNDYFGNLEKLLQEKLSLQVVIADTAENNRDESEDILDQKIKILSIARNLLKKNRHEVIEERLNTLEKLMLKQIHKLGLSSITKIEINRDNFNIYYFQGDIKNIFANISEGEQLRAKLALYLSMVEMDITFNIGKHPRLIILDSPSKEEGDSKFVAGLKDALRNIESDFGINVQILIGTANRSLEDTIPDGEKKVIVPLNQFVF